MDEAVNWLMDIDSWQQVAVLALILGYLIFRQWRDGKKVKQVSNKVDDTNTAVAATAIAVGDVATATEGVLHEVKNNSGSSMKDAVDRIESGQAELVEALGTLGDKFTEHVRIAKASDERLAALEEKYLGPNDHGL